MAEIVLEIGNIIFHVCKYIHENGLNNQQAVHELLTHIQSFNSIIDILKKTTIENGLHMYLQSHLVLMKEIECYLIKIQTDKFKVIKSWNIHAYKLYIFQKKLDENMEKIIKVLDICKYVHSKTFFEKINKDSPIIQSNQITLAYNQSNKSKEQSNFNTIFIWILLKIQEVFAYESSNKSIINNTFYFILNVINNTFKFTLCLISIILLWISIIFIYLFR